MKKILFGLSATSFLILFSIIYSQKYFVLSTPSTNVKDTLSNSQLSYSGRLGVGNSANETIFKIKTNGNEPSRTTNNLFSDDIVGIGRTGTTGLDLYTVRDIANTGQFAVGSNITAANAFAGNAVIATRSAIHTVSFTPKSNVMSGAWQFLIKATNGSIESANDGIPDQGGFDLGSTIPAGPTFGLGTRLQASDISCPFGTASIGSTVILNGNSYHNILCTLAAGATNPIDVGVTITIGRDLSVGSQLINPSPIASQVEGTADVFNFYLRHLDAGGSVINVDTAAGKIAVVEAVRVTATVDPNITFYINATGVGVGSTACGNAAFGSNAAATTATSVAFGSLSVGTYNNLAQRLSCVTNANNGYVVTVYENSPMTDINTGSTIPNTNCDGACTYSTAAVWNSDKTHSEWGYTLQNINVGYTNVAFSYTTGYKAFGVGFAQAQTIMSHNTTPTLMEEAYICYRLTTSTTQPSGNYENKLVYTATATF